MSPLPPLRQENEKDMYRVLILTAVLIAGIAVTAPTASAGPVDCVQVYPWSELCKGEVGEVVCYYTGIDEDRVCGYGLK